MVDVTADQVFKRASESEDLRYLVPHKFHAGPNPRWDACNELVSGGYARWLPTEHTYWPGIVLTGKPYASPGDRNE